MWTRRELKQQAKEALQRNYWKSVLVALVLMVLGGNWIGNVFSSASGVPAKVSSAVVEEASMADEDMSGDISGSENLATIILMEDDTPETVYNKNTDDMNGTEEFIGFIVGFIIMLVIFLIVFLIMIAIMLIYEILLVFPLIVGAGRFMLKSLDGRAEVKDVAYGFDHSYRNVVKTMFHTQLSIFLWALLFLIPGIYKQYQYRMVEYILAEHPDMPYKEAMQMSRDMMNGQKWNAFVLDLSFILWEMLGVLTCGLVHIFYVAPYHCLTNAALYRRLCSIRDGQCA